MNDQEALIAALQGAEGVPMPRPDPRRQVPLPKPDPRTWADRLSRTQNLEYPQPSRETIPPSLLMYLQGIDPSRKHGDAIDYDSRYIETLMAYPHMWRQDI